MTILIILFSITWYKEIWWCLYHSSKNTYTFTRRVAPRLYTRVTYDSWYFKMKRITIPSKKRKLTKKIRYLSVRKKMPKEEIRETVQPYIDEI